MGPSLGATLGIAGLGAMGGSMLASVTGGNTTGGAVGGAIGATAGFLLGGPVGALIGGAAGGALGGLFGPSKKGMAKRAGGDVLYGVDEAGQLTITAARGKRWDEAGSRAAVQEQLDRINAAIRERDLRFEGISGSVGFGPARRRRGRCARHGVGWP